MRFERESGNQTDSTKVADWSAELFNANVDSRPEVSRVSIADLFGDPVIDARLATPPRLDPGLFQTNDSSIGACDSHAITRNQKDSLAATKDGDSILNRMYEMSVLTPKGTTKADQFQNVYGEAVADKMSELGITEINRVGSAVSISLAKPLHYGDDSGTIDIQNKVGFTTSPQGGAVRLDNVSGVTVSSGIFTLSVSKVDLQPREKGYLSGQVSAGFTQTKVCATPDGKINH